MTSPPVSRQPGPVVGRIQQIRRIDGADHVRLAQVDIGRGEPVSIVFGGEQVIKEHDMVPVAPPGTRVPGPVGNRQQMVKMRRRRYRGCDSFGMLCSLRELGYANGSQDRVALLREDLELGTELPKGQGWRHVVVQPNPEDFGPNTEELSLADIQRLLARPASTRHDTK